MPDGVESKINRLTHMLGSDEGFYILALHSFVEYYLREVKDFGDELTFPQLTWKFREQLLEEYGDTFIDGLSSLAQLGRQHHLTNRVRHSFSDIDQEEARAATSMFLRFCRLAGISADRQLKMFSAQLKSWEKHENPAEQSIIIKSLQAELAGLKKKNRSLSSRIDEYLVIKDRLDMLKHELAARELELESLRKTAGSRASKTDELRRERFELKEQINSLLAEREGYIDLQKYLDYMGRLTVYTRSRLDYERLIAELSPEQKAVSDSIAFDRDFLVRGGAGTGKSLVLISGIQRVLSQHRLDFFEDNPVIFITYTKTLVKYSWFTAMLMKMDVPPVLFSTVDTLIYERLKEIDDDFVYDFGVIDEFFEHAELPDFTGKEELAGEIDDFLIGRLVSEEEYMNNRVKREGLKGSPDARQRGITWGLRNSFIEYMEGRRRFSVNYGRMKLAGLMREEHLKKGVKGLQAVFIDEVQDLNPAALAAVKSLTYGPLIMAGDFQQSIYMTSHPFTRAGIDIRGTTRVLKTNFRNTRQVIEKAEAFREKSGAAEKDDTVSFREGPPSEIFIEQEAEALEAELISRLKLFLTELGYDPGNICILVPRNRYIDELEQALDAVGVSTVKVNSDEFDFTKRGSVNISTLHSCKGLDFPVVLIYLPELTRLGRYSDAQGELLLRNLVYTGMTRAMDHLNIFALKSDDPVVKDLIEIYS